MTAFNPTHYRKTWAALGNPTDPVAFDVAGSQSAISLLKGILAEFGFPFIPAHSISFDKLQQVVGPTVLGRGAGLGDVLACTIGRGLQIDTFSNMSVVPDVPMKSEANVWIGQNTFQNPVNIPDGVLGLTIYNVGDLSKRVRVDLTGMPPGNTLTIRPPTVGFDGSGNISYLALLDGINNRFAQPADDDLTALSGLTAVDTIYYRSHDNPPLWAPVVVGAGLVFNQGTLSATGIPPGGGGVSTAGPVNASMLTAFADASGTLIQGVMVSGPGITYASGLLQTTGDLLALENLTGINTIYYRVADATWSPVNVSTGLTFGGGILAVSSVLAAFVGLSPVADTVPYFTAPNNAALTAFTAFGRSLVGTANAGAALTLLGAQPLDADLTSLANAGGTNTIYYRSGASTWSPVTIGANLTFGGGVLAATGGGGGGVTTSGPVTAAMLTGYADATGNLIRGITMPGAGLTLTGSALTLANDLSALEALSGSNTIYYRIGTDSWGPVTIGTNLTFTGGVLNATAAGGGVTTSGAVTASQLTGYADATGTLIRGINLPPAGLALSGNNLVLTNGLASLEAAASIGQIYYLSAADTWSTVLVGGGLGFAAGSLTIQNTALQAIGTLTPAADRLPYFTGNTASSASLAAFTAAARTLLAQPDAASMVGILGAQPLDGDLTSLSGATGTNTIYYRSAANTWSPVVVGTNLTFSGGTLASTGGGGDVFKNLDNTFTAQNAFLNLGVVIGNATPVLSLGLEVHGATINKSSAAFSEWSNDPAFPTIQFNKSRGAAIGTHAAPNVTDLLGELQFNASNGTAFVTRAKIAGSMSATVANAADLNFLTHNGSNLQSRMRLWASGALSLGNYLTVDFGSGWLAGNGLAIKQAADTSTNGIQIAYTGGSAGLIWGDSPGNLNLSATSGTITLWNNSGVKLAAFTPALASITGSNGTVDPAAGIVGQFVQNTNAPASALPAGAYSACINISVPAGDWDLCGMVHVRESTAHTTVYAVLSQTANAGTNNAETTFSGSIGSAFNELYLQVGPVRVRTASTITYWLNCYVAAASVLADSTISIRRRI